MPEARDSVVEINRMLAQLYSYDPSNHSISKVPDFLRGVNEEAYNPTIVAIGPVHHNKDHVQGMHQHKVWYLQQLLERTAQGQNSARQQRNLERYLDIIRNSERTAREYYSTSIQLPDKEKYSEVHYNEVLIQIRRDLLMIENQLPFFILKMLFDLTNDTEDNGDFSLHRLLLSFFRRIIPGEPEVDPNRNSYDVDDHLFGLVYEAHFRDVEVAGGQKNFMFDEINSISELQDAGIKFRKAETTTTLMNVKFSKGVMEIPKLEVGDVTESLFRNLIAYEQIRVDDERTRAEDHPRYVTEYCFLMQFLVNSQKDVEILRRAGIIINWIGDDEAVRLFFNRLTKNVATSQDFYYANIIRSMNDYYLRRKWWVNLKRNYMNSPWKIMSVIAATLLLLMTAVQTVFSILS